MKNRLRNGSSIGTVTDVDGLFTLQTAPQDILVISAIGYETKEVAVEGRSNLNIELAEENLRMIIAGRGQVGGNWNPVYEFAGTCEWRLTGLRQDGVIVLSGPMVLKRIAPNAQLFLK